MSSRMDIAFCLDRSPSMNINLKQICAILKKPIFQNHVDIRLALIEYYSHHDYYVTKTYNFTSSFSEFQTWLNNVQINDRPFDECRATADALDAALALNWRDDINQQNDGQLCEKLVILITDGAPCNLFKNNCRLNTMDLWQISNEFNTRNITLVTVGFEPCIVNCDDFYCALAQNTGGEYIPWQNAAPVISDVIQRAIQYENTVSQLFRRAAIYSNIDLNCCYKHSFIQKRVRDMIEYCQTMHDIRKLFTNNKSSVQWVVYDIEDINSNNLYSYFNSPIRHHSTSSNGICIPACPIAITSARASLTDDEGYRTEMPATASNSSSYGHIIGSLSYPIEMNFSRSLENNAE